MDIALADAGENDHRTKTNSGKYKRTAQNARWIQIQHSSCRWPKDEVAWLLAVIAASTASFYVVQGSDPGYVTEGTSLEPCPSDVSLRRHLAGHGRRGRRTLGRLCRGRQRRYELNLLGRRLVIDGTWHRGPEAAAGDRVPEAKNRADGKSTCGRRRTPRRLAGGSRELHGILLDLRTAAGAATHLHFIRPENRLYIRMIRCSHCARTTAPTATGASRRSTTTAFSSARAWASATTAASGGSSCSRASKSPRASPSYVVLSAWA